MSLGSGLPWAFGGVWTARVDRAGSAGCVLGWIRVPIGQGWPEHGGPSSLTQDGEVVSRGPGQSRCSGLITNRTSASSPSTSGWAPTSPRHGGSLPLPAEAPPASAGRVRAARKLARPVLAERMSVFPNDAAQSASGQARQRQGAGASDAAPVSLDCVAYRRVPGVCPDALPPVVPTQRPAATERLRRQKEAGQRRRAAMSEEAGAAAVAVLARHIDELGEAKAGRPTARTTSRGFRDLRL